MWNRVGYEDGRKGLEWKWRIKDNILYIFIEGTDHFWDLLHHFRTGLIKVDGGIKVTEADLDLIYDITVLIHEKELPVRIGGHSWGGAIAAIIVWALLPHEYDIRGYLFAPKQSGNQQFVDSIADYITAYYHRGDWIPFIQFWLARYPLIRVGKWVNPWKAHQPYMLRDQMEQHGFR